MKIIDLNEKQLEIVENKLSDFDEDTSLTKWTVVFKSELKKMEK